MADYGFGGEPPKINLPKRERKVKVKPTESAIQHIAEAGVAQGYVDRSPEKRRKPGPKQREPQDRVTITGPQRIVDEFRDYCDERGRSYWEGLEALLANQKPE